MGQEEGGAVIWTPSKESCKAHTHYENYISLVQ